MNAQLIERLIERLIENVRGFVQPALDGLGAEVSTALAERDARIAALEERLAAFEGRDARSLADCYRGVFVPGGVYRRGELVTHDGELWLAMRDAEEDRPGSSPAWRLIVAARGRDSRARNAA